MNRVHASLPRDLSGEKPNPRRLLLVDRTGRVYYDNLVAAMTWRRNIGGLQTVVSAGLRGMCDQAFVQKSLDEEIAKVAHGAKISYDMGTLLRELKPFL
ncbi:MAG: hypothetical protein UX77_C0003G0007 [Parcubacteria group bacterium GW2011_GWA1_47_11]|uniref:Uncharacterized protein n=1 Tax=Candidatus Colwellbacteria bacterium GWA2_46_10 TaxID=1797684 RepID=A0A1G1YV22_9BACT|nr:MAG: hypothetical protein UX29_C0007G0009 [Parcubacteria group bacterium GW2011_GWA2_46_10]KKU56129.1 MAG: hypothetical protein UX77_C0003G0007 [Parcubacteria group bacterium GW2011_GWA1_47_11]OGY56248.1 MAG: hypothetical protein A2119_00425 [Candidatus Colwellbacteria bacterium GWA2_46_10]